MAEGDKRILYIEDEPDISRLVSRMLTLEGYTVIEAARGTRGLDVIYESFPHLVLLDLRMSVMSGYEFLEAVKAQSGLREIPVVCVTGLTGLKWIQEAFLRGADGYVFKPVDIDFMVALISFLTVRESLDKKASMLLELPAFGEAGRLAGREVDSLEKLDLLLAVAEAGEEGATVRELAVRVILIHEDLEAEIRGLVAAGALVREGEGGRVRINRSEGWHRRAANLKKVASSNSLLQAFVNGVFTGVLPYGFSAGLFD